MKCDFVKFSPTQNMTIVVTSPVSRDDQRAVAEKLMAYDGLHAEQVGFIETPSVPGAKLRLQMMGGEFCGNAAMCAAVMAAMEMGTQKGDAPIEISGAEGLTVVHVEKTGDTWKCRVNMPLPAEFSEKDGMHMVRLPGITHAVDMGENTGDGEDILRKIAAGEEADAVGLIAYSRGKSAITPLVYVKGTDTMVWEKGCGSGSAAVGALEAYLNKENSCVSLTQPGGIITAEAAWDGEKVSSIAITGSVKIVAEGRAYV